MTEWNYKVTRDAVLEMIDVLRRVRVQNYAIAASEWEKLLPFNTFARCDAGA